MLLVRPVRISDLDDLLTLSQLAGSGMTSLPPERDILQKKIQRSLLSFAHGEYCRDDYFLLVLEDSENQRVVGTAGIYTSTGSDQAFYAYRVTPANHYSHSLQREVRAEILQLTNDYTDCSEIGTLFINGDYRGNGSWLARSRYLLMAQFHHRFSENVIAQVRGWLDDNHQSPFWNAIGQHFFEMDYTEADRLCGTGSNLFITELMPRYPIYTNLLPSSAREAIGRAHRNALPAQALLQKEGFHYENLVDIFDGGPMLRARLNTMATPSAAQQSNVQIENNLAHSASFLIATQSLENFRAARVQGQLSEWGTLLLLPDVCANLQLQEGDAVHYVSLEK